MARVAQVALTLGAASVLLVQGSADGDGLPTCADSFFADCVAAVLAALGIRLADHLLVGVHRTTSFVAHRESATMPDDSVPATSR